MMLNQGWRNVFKSTGHSEKGAIGASKLGHFHDKKGHFPDEMRKLHDETGTFTMKRTLSQ